MRIGAARLVATLLVPATSPPLAVERATTASALSNERAVRNCCKSTNSKQVNESAVASCRGRKVGVRLLNISVNFNLVSPDHAVECLAIHAQHARRCLLVASSVLKYTRNVTTLDG